MPPHVDPSPGPSKPNPRKIWPRRLVSSPLTASAVLFGGSLAATSAVGVIPADWPKLHGLAAQVHSSSAATCLTVIAMAGVILFAIKRLALSGADVADNFGRERATRAEDKETTRLEAETRRIDAETNRLNAEGLRLEAQIHCTLLQRKARAVASGEIFMIAPAGAEFKQVKVDPADWRHSDQNAARKAAPFAPRALASATMPLAMSADEVKAALQDEALQDEKVDVTAEALAEMLRNPEIRPRQELWQPLSRALCLPDDYFVKGTQLTLECCVRRLRRYHDQGRALVHTYASVENPDELRKFSLMHLRMFVVQVETLLEKEKGGTP